MTETLNEAAPITRDDARAGLGASDSGATDWKVVSRLALARISCRAYRPDPVPRAVLDEIFTVAQFSANWCNAQGWDVIVTQGEATERFRRALVARASDPAAGSQPDIPFPADYPGVHGTRRRKSAIELYRAAGITRDDKASAASLMLDNYRLFGAPHVAILTVEAELGAYGVLDCGLYLGNLMQLMQARGIGCIAQGALPRFSPLIREHFAIPENRKIVCGLSFGYADESQPVNACRTSRAPVAKVVRWCED